jgi:hypothetical protein
MAGILTITPKDVNPELAEDVDVRGDFEPLLNSFWGVYSIART